MRVYGDKKCSVTLYLCQAIEAEREKEVVCVGCWYFGEVGFCIRTGTVRGLRCEGASLRGDYMLCFIG